MGYLKEDTQTGRWYFDLDAVSGSDAEEDKKPASIMEQDIGIKMLLHNRVEGIVPINCQYIDEILRVYYETDGMQTLEQRFYDKTISVRTANKILQSLLEAMHSAEPYFMEKEKLLLSEDSVFLDGEGYQVKLCYYPLEEKNVYDGLKRVTEFLMKHLEHSDRKKTAFFYGLHNMIVERSVTMEQLSEHLKRQEVTQKKTEETQGKRHPANKQKEPVEIQHTGFHYLVRKMAVSKDPLVSLAVPKEIPLQGEVFRLGRRQQQDISLMPAQISREHAVIYCEGETVQIEDKNSLNGTYINGRKISAYVKVPCHPGDIITFADIPYELV